MMMIEKLDVLPYPPDDNANIHYCRIWRSGEYLTRSLWHPERTLNIAELELEDAIIGVYEDNLFAWFCSDVSLKWFMVRASDTITRDEIAALFKRG